MPKSARRAQILGLLMGYGRTWTRLRHNSWDAPGLSSACLKQEQHGFDSRLYKCHKFNARHRLCATADFGTFFAPSPATKNNSSPASWVIA